LYPEYCTGGKRRADLVVAVVRSRDEKVILIVECKVGTCTSDHVWSEAREQLIGYLEDCRCLNGIAAVGSKWRTYMGVLATDDTGQVVLDDENQVRVASYAEYPRQDLEDEDGYMQLMNLLPIFKLSGA